MERWCVGVNGYFGSASIIREDGPWWSFAIEKATSVIGGLLHYGIGWVKFPAFVTERVISVPVEAKLSADEKVTWGDWHGDTVDHRLSWYTTVIFQWCFGQRKMVMIHVSMADLSKAYGDQAPPFWRRDWEDGTKQWADSGPPSRDCGEVFRTADEAYPC